MQLDRNAIFRSLLICASAMLLPACATAPGPDLYSQDVFRRGDVVLGCDTLACASGWRWKSSELQARYEQQAWEDLAREVTNLQYSSDLAYFYLGRAAESMQSPSAAKKYFDRVETAARRCAEGFFNGCGDILVAEEAKQRSDRLAAELLEAATMDLVEAQSRLQQLGLYTAAVDGITGPRTVAALKQFQAREGINVTGELTAATMLALAGTATLPAIPKAPVAVTRAPATVPTKPKASASPVVLPEAAPADVSALKPPAPTLAPPPKPATENNEGERTRVKVEVEVLATADPFAQPLIVVEQGAWVTVISRGLEWSKIAYKDAIGFVYSDSLQ